MQNKLILIGCAALEHASRCFDPSDRCRQIVEADIYALRSGHDPQLQLQRTKKERERRIYKTSQGELLIGARELLQLQTREFGTWKILAVCTRCWSAVEQMNGYVPGRYESYWQEFALHPCLLDQDLSFDYTKAVNTPAEYRIEQVGREFNVHVGLSPTPAEVFAGREQAEEFIRIGSEELYLKPRKKQQ